MTAAAVVPSTANETTVEPFGHLPGAMVLEDTITSLRGDLPREPDDGRNAFIAVAAGAGG